MIRNTPKPDEEEVKEKEKYDLPLTFRQQCKIKKELSTSSNATFFRSI